MPNRVFQVVTDDLIFSFERVQNAYKFDDNDKASPHLHGVSVLKAVDILVETRDALFLIEAKDYRKALSEYNSHHGHKTAEEIVIELKNTLKLKARDSYLYIHAEQNPRKSIHFVCLLIDLDPVYLSELQKYLKRELPVGRSGPRWKKSLFDAVHVLGAKEFREVFPDWEFE